MADLEDESLAINSIYENGMVQKAQNIFQIQIPETKVTVRLSFSSAYPERSPEVLSVNDGRDKLLLEMMKAILSSCFHPGEVCVFDFMDSAREILQEYGLADEEEPEKDTEISTSTSNASTKQDYTIGWSESDPIQDRGSVFVGRATEVHSEDEAEEKLMSLKCDKRISRANHNMIAWRIKREDGVMFEDCDDDGETASGGRLLHLLQLTDATNVVVLVSRWFGGTHIGPDRFRHINNAAREALDRGGFIKGHR